MINQPIQKKNYSTGSNDKQGLVNFYVNFLKTNNCKGLFTILNKFSRIDALLQSGDTSICVEYKNRPFSISKYSNGAMLEREKHISLVTSSKLFDAPAVYIVEYDDAIVIYDIQHSEYQYTWQTMPCPSELHGGYIVDKQVTILPFATASIIVAKRTWTRASVDQLNRYFELKAI